MHSSLAQPTAELVPDLNDLRLNLETIVGGTGPQEAVDRLAQVLSARLQTRCEIRPTRTVETPEKVSREDTITIPLLVNNSPVGAILFQPPPCPKRLEAYTNFLRSIAGLAAVTVYSATLECELAEQEAEREELLSLISHDLRNPLTALLVSSALIEERADAVTGDNASRIRRLSANLRRSAERMNFMLGDILDFFRLQSGRFSLSRSACQVAGHFAEVQRLVGPSAVQRAVRLAVSSPASELIVWADPERLTRVLVSLATLVTAHAPRSAEVSIEAQQAHERVEIVMRCSDDQALAPICEQLAAPAKFPLQGADITLLAARKIIERHGGVLQATAGTISCSLPIAA